MTVTCFGIGLSATSAHAKVTLITKVKATRLQCRETIGRHPAVGTRRREDDEQWSVLGNGNKQ